LEEFINGLIEKTGISKEQATQVIEFIKDHASELPKLIGENQFLSGLADKLPEGIADRIGL